MQNHCKAVSVGGVVVVVPAEPVSDKPRWALPGGRVTEDQDEVLAYVRWWRNNLKKGETHDV
jgi:hypothetical protein